MYTFTAEYIFNVPQSSKN